MKKVFHIPHNWIFVKSSYSHYILHNSLAELLFTYDISGPIVPELLVVVATNQPLHAHQASTSQCKQGIFVSMHPSFPWLWKKLFFP